MKHIVVIIDGTWVSAADGENPFSNAYNLNWMLDSKARDANPQIVFYSSGIGTDKGIESYFDGATAQGIDNQVREAYINICSNFRGGSQPDKLYLFGFSRGAVVARALASLISNFGILRPQYMDLFPALWSRFTSQDDGATRYFTTNRLAHQNVPIDFVGLFDCVFGFRGNKGIYYTLRFKDFSVPKNIRFAVQLLSLDDQRKAFEPMLWDGIEEGGLATVLEQIWMPGVHSDVGGTYKSNAMGRIALLSMVDLVLQRTQLGFHCPSVARMEHGLSKPPEINSELNGFWRLMSVLPFRRNCDPRHASQYLHPVAVDLWTKYKGKAFDRYTSAARNADQLRVYDGFTRRDWAGLIFPTDQHDSQADASGE